MSQGDEAPSSPFERVWRSAAADPRTALERALPPSDVRSLLLDVADARARAVRPREVLNRWTTDRFVRPAQVDARTLAAVEARLWSVVPRAFEGVALSPVAPLGTASAVAPVSQRRVVTTMRLSEVVSDSTNALAVEAAVRRARLPAGTDVDLAASHRQLRAQDPGAGTAHFHLFALVSSGRDRGSRRTETELLTRHLEAWRAVLEHTIPHRDPTIAITAWEPGYADVVRMLVARSAGGPVRLVEDPERTRASSYYAGLGLRLLADGGAVELGDGGLTTWTADLLSNAKERCVVSCIATERLVDLISAPSVAQ